MSNDQLVMALQAEVLAYETHRSAERMQALQKAAAACRAAKIDVGSILTFTVVDIHDPDEMARRIRAAIAGLPLTPAPGLTTRMPRWTRQRHNLP
ncbi:hypothetical protein [Nocardia fusca]|uniref:hypothetical protein n=1 Tax=Nocardia fusca TaxID=941183 RepID=UPI0007A74E49|nr:hypothetical protein [Nocardia fusca]